MAFKLTFKTNAAVYVPTVCSPDNAHTVVHT